MERYEHISGYYRRVFTRRLKGTGYAMPTIIGFDTETKEGPPITAQFYSEQMPAINACLFVNEGNVTQQCLRHLAKHCRFGEFVVYGHNLKFDMLSLFYPHARDMVKKKDGSFKFTYDRWTIEGIYGTPTYCRMERKDVRISIVDSFSWFRSSLDKAARLVCPGLPKLPRPKGLGQKDFDQDDMEFIEYAMRDAEVAFHIGVAIDEMHQEFDLRQSISIANMAANIFQQHYISETAPIFNTGPRILAGARASYHGGKTTYTLRRHLPGTVTLTPGTSQARTRTLCQSCPLFLNQTSTLRRECSAKRVARCQSSASIRSAAKPANAHGRVSTKATNERCNQSEARSKTSG